MTRLAPRGLVAATTVLVAAGTASADVTILAPGPLLESISAEGTAAGSFNAPEYFIWRPGEGVTLIGGDNSAGQASISDDGLFVAGTVLDPSTGLVGMGRYDVAAGAWTPIDGIGGESGGSIGSGWGITGDGLSVVGLGWVDAGTAHAVQWSAATGDTVDLGSTSPGNSSRANATDLDGDVVVGWQDGNGRQGAVWVNGVQELIERPDGSPAGEAQAVSADGRWVTGISFSSPFGVASTYRYDAVDDTVEIIPNLTVGGQSRMAGTAVSSDGSMIVGGTWPLGPATFGTGFVWREGVGTVTVPEYLDELGIAYDPSYTFAFVADMSDDGRWMVGWGRTSNNSLTSWVLEIPGDEPCPADLDGSGAVDFDDLLALLSAWGECAGCPEDLDGSGAVAFDDLLSLLSAFGPCP